jgi:pyridoxal phosphate enzyme (YggS family)
MVRTIMGSIEVNLQQVGARIRAACAAAGRDERSVTLLAVSKTFPPDAVRAAHAAGQAAFGENYVQEALAKMAALADLRPSLRWHFIGPLQSNKARSVAELFDVVQSVDSRRLAEKLSQAAAALGKSLRIYAQVNISREPQKQGFDLDGAEGEILGLAALPSLRLEGLMGMAAASDDPENARPAFQALYALRQSLQPRGLDLKLSMGMSHDFEVAIEEGADLLRIGTALFQ